MKRDALASVLPSAIAPVGPALTWPVALVALTVALAWIATWYFGTAAAMVGIWIRSETFAHGFVVAPISLWLIWRDRERLRALEPQPSWVALPFLAAAGFAWLLGQVAAVNSVTQFAFVAMLVLTVPAILGIRISRATMFPLGFLFFSVPIGEFLLPTLMVHTADFTVLALRASGVPVYREGLQFIIPTGRWSVVEACSGVRYLIASLMVGTLFAYLNYATSWRRWVFVGVAIAVPVVANWLRAYMIVMLGHLSENRIATGVDHIIYGWVFFGIVMLAMFAIGAAWRETPQHSAATSANFTQPSASPGRLRAVTLGVMGVMVVTMLWPLVDQAMQMHDGDASASLPLIEVPGWEVTPAGENSFAPHFEAASAVRHETLRRNDREVGLFVAYYRGQNTEHKLVTTDNVIVRNDDRTWHVIERGVRQASIGTESARVITVRIRRSDSRMLAARQWYWINGRLTSSDVLAKALIAWSRILGRGDDSAVIVLYTDAQGAGDPDQVLQAFTHEAWTHIDAALSDARAGR